MKLVVMLNGQKLIFNNKNEFVDVYREDQDTFQGVEFDTKNTTQVSIDDQIQDEYTDYSSLIIGLVAALLVAGILGVLCFLQYKFVICKQFLCIKCKRKGKGMSFSTSTTPHPTSPTPNPGETITPNDNNQFNAMDLVHQRKNNKDDLENDDSENDSES